MQDAPLTTQYRELLAITGELTGGESIVADYRLGTDAKIDVRARSGNILFQVRLDAARSIGLVSQYQDRRWRELARTEIPAQGQVRMAVMDSNRIEVAFDQKQPAILPIDVSNVARLHGTGDWGVFQRAGTVMSATEDLLVKQLPRNSAQPAYRDDLVFDIGFYDGNDTAYYLWRGLSVVAVEANPLLAERGAAYFRQAIASGQLTIVNCAIGEKDGVLPFFVNRVRPEWSSTKQQTAARGLDVEEIKIQTITAAALFQTYGIPRYAKIDIEGQDLGVVRALESLSEKPLYVSFEVGPGVVTPALESLARSGYQYFNIVDQSKIHLTVDHRLLPQESALPSPDSFQFRRGSSGTFGDRLGGPWLDVASAKKWATEFLKRLAERNADFQKTRRVTFGDWFDIHAAK